MPVRCHGGPVPLQEPPVFLTPLQTLTFFSIAVTKHQGTEFQRVRVQGGRGEGSKWQAAGIVAENSYLDPPNKKQNTREIV